MHDPKLALTVTALLAAQRFYLSLDLLVRRVGGMLIGPIMLLIVVPALQLVFLRKSTAINGDAIDGELDPDQR